MLVQRVHKMQRSLGIVLENKKRERWPQNKRKKWSILKLLISARPVWGIHHQGIRRQPNFVEIPQKKWKVFVLFDI